MARFLLAEVSALPEDYRQALVLTELEGLTSREAARLAGVSLSAMKSRVRRGRLLPRQRADECCQVEFDGRDRVMDCEARATNGSC